MKEKIPAQTFTVNQKTIITGAHGGNLAYPEYLIQIEGCNVGAIAKGIVRMLNEDQCPACGKFNGLHGEIYHVDSMDNGEVRGHYEMCPNAKK